jgi:hypothetical protein
MLFVNAIVACMALAVRVYCLFSCVSMGAAALPILQEVSCFGWWLAIAQVSTLEADECRLHGCCRQSLFRCAFVEIARRPRQYLKSHPPPRWLMAHIQLKYTPPLLWNLIVHCRCHYSPTWLLPSESLQLCIDGSSSSTSLAIYQDVSLQAHVSTVEADACP